ncbi:lytic transglycosylase domain-containing protein [Phosphitispora sp. TUW77]|uniref:lytic transglycosylase domain-containing protein n=1 Tax=Phosphitispora sp. TUW77 TaxID=3152361 RepID=UPI003AB4D96F
MRKLLRKRRSRYSGIIWLVLLAAILAMLGSKCFWRVFYPLPFKELIFSQAEKNNIDPYLVAAIIKTESNFVPTAESPMGAKGIMQIMPETGAWAAEKMKLREFKPDDLYDPEINIKIGAWYISDLTNEFKGNKMVVVAAYNGGRGNVREWLEQGIWTGEHAGVDQIPFTETREYVKKVLRNYSWYRYLYQEDA